MRGRGLGNANGTVPTFLIEYTLPTTSGSGLIWDIDTVYQIGGGTSSPSLQEGEQWKVEFFTDDPIDGPVELEELEQISPLGEPVWVPDNQAAIDNFNNIYGNRPNLNRRDQQRLPLEDTDPNGRSIEGWKYNPNSFDGRSWQWSFDTTQQGQTVDFVRVSYIGGKARKNVGFAFDQFQAFGQPTGTADFLFGGETASLGNFVFFDRNADGIQDTGEEGVANVTT